jgi:hypothetical protein
VRWLELVDIDLAWVIQVTSVNIVVAAATAELHADKVAAVEGARALWRAILDLGYEFDLRGQDRDRLAFGLALGSCFGTAAVGR